MKRLNNVTARSRSNIGQPIEWESLDKSKKPIEWAQEIKRKVYLLKEGR